MPEIETTPRPPLGLRRGANVDGELLAAIASRDPRAPRAIYDRHAGYAFAVALRILRDRAEAEEAVQDAIWQIWTGRFRYDPLRGRFRTWLFAIARGRALDRLRRRRRMQAPSAADPRAGGEPNGVAPAGHELLAALSAEQRDAITLAFYLGMTRTEIAKRLGEPPDAVRHLLREGLLALRDALAESEAAP